MHARAVGLMNGCVTRDKMILFHFNEWGFASMTLVQPVGTWAVMSEEAGRGVGAGAQLTVSSKRYSLVPSAFGIGERDRLHEKLDIRVLSAFNDGVHIAHFHNSAPVQNDYVI